METSQVLACVRRLAVYLNQNSTKDHNDSNDTCVRNILKILVRYVEVRQRTQINPITPNYVSLLVTYIEHIRNVLPADIIATIESAVNIIQNDNTSTHHVNTNSVFEHHNHRVVMTRTPTHTNHVQIESPYTQEHSVSMEECEKYENLRRGADRIREKLTELESTPNTDPIYVSSLVTHLGKVIKYISDFEKKYGGGASKF